jgi:hypothetical protein
MRKSWLVFILFTLLIDPGCSGDGNRTSTIFNPNGDSELALLMRNMYDDGMVTKQQMLEGKNPEVRVKYHRLHTAKATQPEKVATPNFDAFASAYEVAVNSFLESDASHRAESYHSMIDACMNCHQDICPGPTRKIKHLYLSDAEKASLVAEDK